MKVGLDPAAQSKASMTGSAALIARLAPWLVEVGTWTLGGLIALNLVVIAALITVGPVDRAVLISVAAFACALPLDVAGIVLLRLIKDVQDIRLEEVTLQSFKEAQFPDIEAYFPPERDRDLLARKRARIALGYGFVIVALCVALTLAGLGAALWHMAAWVAEAFAGAVVLSVAVLGLVVARSLPPASEAEKALRRQRGSPTPS